MSLFQFQDPGSSFYQLLTSQYPQMLPSLPGHGEKKDWSQMIPHGTTVLSLLYRDGIVIAGDRRATEGYSISERRIEKVHKTDGYSAIAIAGAAGPCLEMTRLFRIELEHYEKLEGAELSMEGKANKLAQMIKANLPMAMQGLVVVPIFAGYDVKRGVGRIFKYDIAGGQYEETEYYAIGSGGRDARGTLKKIFKKDLTQEGAVQASLEALYDASEADVATGGPDLIRNIFPTVKVINRQGVFDVPDEEIRTLVQNLVNQEGGG